MAKIKQRNPKPVVDFPGRDKCIKIVHNILRSVEFNFECEAEDGEVLDNDLMMDLTIGDIARQVVDHPDFIMAVPGVRLEERTPFDLAELKAEHELQDKLEVMQEAQAEAEAEFNAMQEAHDLHQAQQAAEADSHFF